ncbi:hypothetical protein L9F63_015335 [Diploptera punctata]|uniref:Ras modification protein ERF4 n=1 Tax=Diploptera punctata TaxID=6984 RepID=A0AAD8A6A1_DIPPU|nr:hypothetical protein L9F63_015335 [Diploptera punctata]
MEISRRQALENHTTTTPLEDMAAARAVNGNNQCLKVFVQRDYSEGTLVKFQTRFPTELEERIERQAFEYTVNQLNAIYAEAEKAGCSTYCEGCMACLTAYLIYICTETHYEKCLRKVAKFVVEQNERVYAPRGLLITDPTERGLRVIEISILNEPAATRT